MARVVGDPAFDPDRPRFYILDRELSAKPYGLIENEAELFPTGDRLRSRQVEIPGLRPADAGLPRFSAKPRLVVQTRGSRVRPTDIYNEGSSKIFSTALHEIVKRHDPDAMETAECDAVNLRGDRLAPFWWTEVVTFLDCVDEERSAYTTQAEGMFPENREKLRHLYLDLFDLHMTPAVAGHHIFRLIRAFNYVIISQVIADEIRAQQLRGVHLTPLQPPTPDERKGHLYFLNYPYWTDKGYGA